MHLLRKFEFLWKNVTTNPDEHIIDALIFGSNCRRTQTKLLEKDATLALDTALDIVRTEEVTRKLKEFLAMFLLVLMY